VRGCLFLAEIVPSKMIDFVVEFREVIGNSFQNVSPRKDK